jgi:hypothetical protein
MRILFGFLIAVLFASGARASVEIPFSSTVEIDGPGLGLLDFGLNLSASFPPLGPGLEQKLLNASVVVTQLGVNGSSFTLYNCASNAPGPGACLTTYHHAILVTDPTNVFTISDLFIGASPGVTNIVASVYLDVPSGFAVTAVPELSTWAMLVFGFAALALIKSRKTLRVREPVIASCQGKIRLIEITALDAASVAVNRVRIPS